MGKRAGDAGAPSPAKKLLETERASMHQGHVKEWARQAKHYVDHSLLSFLGQRKREVSFAVPAKCSLLPPLAITDAAAGANLSSLREVMDYDNLVASFSRTKECEAAGAARTLDPTCSDIDDVTVRQLEGAMGAWSDEAHPLSSKHAPSRRLSFDVPIPALAVDAKVAQRLEPNKPGACSTEALTTLAERAAAITRRAAMGEALQQSIEDRARHLFNAALSVPIRMRLLPDGLRPFVLDGACSSAFALAEAHFPELRESALLMGIGFACSTRAVSDAKARELFVVVVNSIRAARWAGDAPKGEELPASRVIGRDGKTPAMPRALFKKKELVEYIPPGAFLMNKGVGNDMAAFKTLLHIPQKFAASGADGPVASHRAPDSGGGADGMETLFALRVAEHRNAVDVKTKELQNSTTGFVWHACLAETSQCVGAKHRDFAAARAGGPTPADPELDANLGLPGMSELGDEQKEELQKLQGQPKQLRRKAVKFVSLPSVGAASGAEYAVAQMQSLWDALSLGHRFGGKKNDVRAFILSAELFPPNVAKQGGKARMSEQMARDEAKFKRVTGFFLQKRQSDDIPIFLDGRSRANRRAIESFEAKWESGGTRAHVGRWFAHEQPTKKEDPRSAARASSYTNNRETAIFSTPLKGPPRKVAHRAGFNARGESSTADASYSGIPMRRFSELPLMDHETKTSILGAASCASADGGPPRLQGDIGSKGHPFSHSEVEPLSLWQTLV
ncbi:unnamed protein product [Prorocentrum cordatum]|uniref:Uncharacterized protein n=1 Tax=Prorocentrum cordatum TaxID=2364126 RepID=A0ABN9UJW6_9DINO|nr:unnamed protein product [Polarella glacialis]